MVQQLRLLDPAMSLEVGTPERKIVDTVAEFVAGSQVDYSVLLRQHDLDAMTGGRLDAYLGNFGWGRQQPRAAVGRVTFSRTGAALDPVTIPRGTQLAGTVDTSAYPNVIFITTETAVMGTDSTSVDAPVRCTTYGTIGNLAANTITSFAGLRGVSGVTSVTNTQPTSGGLDGEDDAAYKLRFKNTIFRNMSGTYDQILALAVSAPTVSKANVVGPISRYVELIQLPSITDEGENEIQTISVDNADVNFTITIKDELGVTVATTASITNGTPGATAGAEIEDAINTALDSEFGTSGELYVSVTTTGTGPYTHTVEFIGRMGRRNLALMTCSDGSVSASIAQSNAGVAPTGIDDIQTTADGTFGYDNHVGTVDDPYNFPFKITTATSTIPYSKYTFPENHFLTDSTLDPGSAYFYRAGVDYYFNEIPISASAGDPFQASTDYDVGDIVKGDGATGAGRLFVVAEAGTSDGSSPTWNTAIQYSSETDSGSVTFVYAGLSTGSAFQVSHNYALNDVVQYEDDLFIVTADAGSSDSSIPSWNAINIGDTTVSSGITFTYLGPVRHYYISDAFPCQPNVTILIDQGGDGGLVWPSGMSNGSILLLEHQYTSTNSRNEYDLGITNCIDVFVNGGEETNVDSTEVISGTSHNLQSTDSNHWTYQKLTEPRVVNFERGIDGRACSLGNRLTPLFWQPVLELPNEITIGQNKYLRGNYYLGDGEAFEALTAYVVGQAVRDGNNLFVCVTAGTSGAAAPTWDITPPASTVTGWPDGIVTTSGTAVFMYFGTVSSGCYFNERSGSGTAASPYLYTSPAHYVYARSINANAGTVRAKDGIEWLYDAPIGNGGLLGILTDDDGVETYTGLASIDSNNQGVQFDVSGYIYDQNIEYLQGLQESHKQVTTDVLVHRALRRYFKVYVTVMYSIGATESIVNAGIDAALAAFYENQYYGAAIQLSDILQTIHNVPGVDNVRWTADRRYDTVPEWVDATAYTRGTIVRPTTDMGFVFECISAGTSGGSEPTWPGTDGDSVTDGTVTWRALTEVRIEETNPLGEALESGSIYFTNDFFIEDRELAAAPSENASVIVKRAQQTWTS